MHNINSKPDFRQLYEASILNATGDHSGKQFAISTHHPASLSVKTTIYVFLVIALVVMVIAMSFALIGAWPVLIYAIIVLLGLSAGFGHTLKKSHNFEQISLQENTIKVTAQSLSQHQESEMNSAWAKVVMECQSQGDCRYLALRSHGKEIEIGRYISTEARYLLALKLKNILSAYR
ncbi:MAG TPA: DUF2244 domain-containing protein [Methylotenera sp.]|nr:DUF2244 domain-containing protein [Methylotenera sp.]HPH07648.1 DUF2244 domain-containing protein [Methylotenera sp.]HPM49598.1 DUF2244 domain-containing protein [Methylotenera sp.]